LTGRFGWQAVFWINPPLAMVAVALLWVSAPADRKEPRRFDFVGATLIALSLGVLTWSLSQIGHGAPRAGSAFGPDIGALAAGGLGLAGLGVYVAWERVSAHPMTPPRLAQNRAFVGMNAATLLIYAGLAIVFFLLPFELVDRRGLSLASVGLAFLPFALGVGLLSRFFGGLADAVGARRMLVAGAVCASAAYIWMALAQGGALIPGVLAPQAVLGISFAALAAHRLGAVERADIRRGTRIGDQQCNRSRRAARWRRTGRRPRDAELRMAMGIVGRGRAVGGWRPDDGARSTIGPVRTHCILLASSIQFSS
jgi:predicted MFS family arabinose efflux permease